MARVDKILVPTDYSEASVKAVRYAADLGRELKSELKVLHILELGDFLRYSTEPHRTGMNLLEIAEEAARKEMQRLAESLGKDVKFTSEIVTAPGPVPKLICDEAAKWKADWIIMATHGRAGLDRWVMGSVAERVVRAAPCAVLTYRVPDRKG